MSRYWPQVWREAMAGPDVELLKALDQERCEKCDGSGEYQVGCAMVRPIMWPCFACDGTGFKKGT